MPECDVMWILFSSSVISDHQGHQSVSAKLKNVKGECYFYEN